MLLKKFHKKKKINKKKKTTINACFKNIIETKKKNEIKKKFYCKLFFLIFFIFQNKKFQIWRMKFQIKNFKLPKTSYDFFWEFEILNLEFHFPNLKFLIFIFLISTLLKFE